MIEALGRCKIGVSGSWRGNGESRFTVTGTHRSVWGQRVVCWLELRGSGRAAMGDEAGKRVGTGLLESGFSAADRREPSSTGLGLSFRK